MEKLKLDRITLKKFGITMGAAFLAIALIILIRHRHSVSPATIISVLFFTIALMRPILLEQAYIFWMKFAFVLGWINTRIILVIIFYLIFTPVGIFMRLLGYDPLERRIDKNQVSYWKKKEKREFSPLNYTRLF